MPILEQIATSFRAVTRQFGFFFICENLNLCKNGGTQEAYRYRIIGQGDGRVGTLLSILNSSNFIEMKNQISTGSAQHDHHVQSTRQHIQNCAFRYTAVSVHKINDMYPPLHGKSGQQSRNRAARPSGINLVINRPCCFFHRLQITEGTCMLTAKLCCRSSRLVSRIPSHPTM